MRKLLKKIYEKSEAIICTGHSFVFVFDIEKEKFEEVFFYVADWKDFSGLMMHSSELDEIMDLYKKDGKPYALGDCDEDGLRIDQGTWFDFEEEVLKYRKKKEYSKSYSKSFYGSGTIPSWKLLDKNQKKIINDLVKEFVKLNRHENAEES